MAELARGLSDKYRVYSVDLPGHGETPRGSSADFSALAVSLVGFLEEHDLHDVVLIGHSMGGVLSLMTAGLTQRVAGVVNLDGAVPLKPAARAAYAHLFEDVRQQGYQKTMRPFLRQAFFLPQELGEISESLIDDMLSAEEHWAAALLQQFPHLNADSILRELPLPILYIGAESPRFDEAAVLALRPQTAVARITGAGHFLQIFAVSQVIDLVKKFTAIRGSRTC